LVTDLKASIDDALRRLSPKSNMAKALAYGRKRWDALSRFLDEGGAEIDNNIAERAMRSVAIGRKNWLFAGSKPVASAPLTSIPSSKPAYAAHGIGLLMPTGELCRAPWKDDLKFNGHAL
jgi:hypothetical protein